MTHADYGSDYEAIVVDTDSYLPGGYSLDLGQLVETDTYPSFTIPTMSWTSDFTVECFVKSITTLPGPIAVFGAEDANLNYWVEVEQASNGIGRLWVHSPPVGREQTFAGTFNDGSDLGVWIHTALQYDSTNNIVTLARDGEYKEKSYTLAVETGSPLRVGKLDTYNSSKILDGFVSNLRVSDVIRYPSAYTIPDPSTWSSTDANVVMYADFTAIADPITVTPSSLFASVSWEEESPGYYYTLTLTDNGTTTIVVSGTQDLSLVINNLVSETEYTVTLSGSDDNTTYVELGLKTFTTLENTALNFDKAVLDDGSGRFDMSGMSDATWIEAEPLLNDIYTTGDTLKVSTTGGDIEDASFVNLSGTISFEKDTSIVLPFLTTGGTGQEATVTLSDTSTEVVTYNEALDTITVGGTTYAIGDTFVLDGQRVQVLDL